MKSFREYIIEKEEMEQPTVTGIHYSHKPDLTTLSGSMSGTGIKGAEQERLRQTKDERIKKRVYFYPHTGGESSLPRPEEGLGIHTYQAELKNMFDARKHSKETNKIHETAKKYEAEGEHPSNAFERAVLDHGYKGYHTGNMSVALGGNVPVKYTGTRIGKSFYDTKQDTSAPKHSVFDSAASKEGIHTSSMLSQPQTMFFLKNKSKLQEKVPSLKMQYGRLTVHKDHLNDLTDVLKEHPDHPF